jgi:hypothetical protein
VTPHDLTIVDGNAQRVSVAGEWTLSIHHKGKVEIPVIVY